MDIVRESIRIGGRNGVLPMETRHQPPREKYKAGIRKDKMLEVVLATRNLGKAREIKGCLEDENVLILSLNDFPHVREVKEDGKTFQENALQKARQVARATGKLALADDSGLEVDALAGEPGVRSARFAGEKATDEENNKKLLKALRGLPTDRRGASFRCVLAVADSSGKERIVEEACRGVITQEERGEKGFGYDPVFFYPPLGKTFAELTPDEKNAVSHRGKALRRMRKILKEQASTDDPC